MSLNFNVYNTAQTNIRSLWGRVLYEAGFTTSSMYEDGITTITKDSAVVFDGVPYSVSGTQPYTTTGTNYKSFVNDVVFLKPVTGITLRQNLMTRSIGAAMIAAPELGVISDYVSGITFKACGCVGDGIADDTAAVKVAMEYLRRGWFVWSSSPSEVYLVSENIVVTAGRGRLEMNGSTFLASPNMQTGYVCTVKGVPGYNGGSDLQINIQGPYGSYRGFSRPPADIPTGLNLSGLLIGDPDGLSQVSDVKFHNIKVEGFSKCISTGPKSVYLLTFYTPFIGMAWDKAWDFASVTDAGENVAIYHGKTYNCLNKFGTATNLYVSANSQYLDLYVNNHSFDYSDICINMESGIVVLSGCHLENNSNNPYGILKYTDAKIKPQLLLDNTRVDGGNPNATTYANQGDGKGRPVYFYTSGPCSLVGRGNQWGSYGRYANGSALHAYDPGNNAPIKVLFQDIFLDLQSHSDYVRSSPVASPLYNANLSTGTTDGWELVVVGGSTTDTTTRPQMTVDTDSDIGTCIKLTGPYASGGVSAIAGQRVPVLPGGTMYVSGVWKYTNLNSRVGACYPRVHFFTQNGVSLGFTRVSGTGAGGASSESLPMTLFSLPVRVPSGAAYCVVGLGMYQCQGDVFMGKLDVICM